MKSKTKRKMIAVLLIICWKKSCFVIVSDFEVFNTSWIGRDDVFIVNRKTVKIKKISNRSGIWL